MFDNQFQITKQRIEYACALGLHPVDYKSGETNGKSTLIKNNVERV
jgi:hypothetical protein